MKGLDLTGLSRHYAGRAAPALQDITLRCEGGALLALLGPSGSGKSTLLKILAGLERPDAGTVCLDGADLLAVPAHRRGAVLMFQKPYLFPFLNVFENVAFGLRVRRTPQAAVAARVDELLALVGLRGFGPRRPAEISGGEQQRVALARALAVQPRLLLLDEPFSSLDTQVRQELQQTVRRLQQELALTTVLVTHDLAEAVTMADHVALLGAGKLLEHGAPQQIFTRPRSVAAARFVGIRTFLRGTLAHNLLHCESGPLIVPPVSGPRRAATFAIRPERIQILTALGPNAVPATVTASRYRGETTDVELDMRGEPATARISSGAPPPVGAAVWLYFPPEALFEVREDLD